MKNMKKKDRQELGKYIRHIANEMELRDWHINLPNKDPQRETADAEVRPTYGRKYASIFLRDSIRDMDLEYIRYMIVHELTHLHFAVLQDQAEDDLNHVISSGEEHMFFQNFKRNVEYTIDGCAQAIAKHMPLIEWPTK